MIRIAIVEDEKIWQETYREYLKRYVTETHEAIETDVYSDGMDFISDYAGGYDIILMDIAMPHMNGLDSARLLRKVDSNVCLLYITTLSQFAIKGYEVGAPDFLVKPVGYELFKIKLEKAIAASDRSRKTSFSIAVQGGARKIPLSDILYIESNKHYLYFHTQKEELKMRGSLDDVKSFFYEF